MPAIPTRIHGVIDYLAGALLKAGGIGAAAIGDTHWTPRAAEA